MVKADLVEKLKRDLDEMDTIPTISTLLNKFTEMVNNPRCSIQQIGEEISKDQGISMKVLKLVNSAFYGFPGRISTVTHALILLGYDVVKSLILSASVLDMMSDKMSNLWRHSMATSITSGILAKMIEHPSPEEVSMAGLLHDMGKLIMKLKIPEEMDEVFEYASQNACLETEAEKAVLGFDHAEVAVWICNKWNLPEKLRWPISMHHRLERTEENWKEIVLVHLADVLVTAKGYGSNPAGLVPPIDQAVLETIGVDRDFLSKALDLMDEGLMELPLNEEANSAEGGSDLQESPADAVRTEEAHTLH